MLRPPRGTNRKYCVTDPREAASFFAYRARPPPDVCETVLEVLRLPAATGAGAPQGVAYAPPPMYVPAPSFLRGTPESSFLMS